MKVFDVNVFRDGKWWMVAIPAIDGLTQGRRLSEAEHMARDYIVVSQDLAPSTFTLGEVAIDVAGTDFGPVIREIAEARAEARRTEDAAVALMRTTAKRLRSAGVPLRDIATVLTVTHQRVHQLLRGA